MAKNRATDPRMQEPHRWHMCQLLLAAGLGRAGPMRAVCSRLLQVRECFPELLQPTAKFPVETGDLKGVCCRGSSRKGDQDGKDNQSFEEALKETCLLEKKA